MPLPSKNVMYSKCNVLPHGTPSMVLGKLDRIRPNSAYGIKMVLLFYKKEFLLKSLLMGRHKLCLYFYSTQSKVFCCNL